jgi:hypothetical protein
MIRRKEPSIKDVLNLVKAQNKRFDANKRVEAREKLQVEAAPKKKAKGLLYYFVVYLWSRYVAEEQKEVIGYGNVVVAMRKTIGRDNYKTLLRGTKVKVDRQSGGDNNIVVLNYLQLRGYGES